MQRTTGPRVKLYGERNTGTNYLSGLIELNLNVLQLSGILPRWLARLQRRAPGHEWLLNTYFALTFDRNLGWKHALVRTADALASLPVVQQELAFVTLTKNPYSWLLSLFDRPYHWLGPRTSTFSQFVTTPWRSVARENADAGFRDPVDLWNRKNRAYIELRDRFPIRRLTYEGLLRSPQQTLVDLADAFGWQWKSAGFRNLTESTKDDGKGFEDFRHYYLGDVWRNRLDAESLAAINQRLDPEVMAFFGYERLDETNTTAS